MNLTLEQRKQIAEWMGYSAEIAGDEVWLYHCNVDTSHNPAPGSNMKILSTVWEPEICDSQAMELLRKWLTEIEDTLPRQQYQNKVLRLMGNLDNLSICHAVLALTENQE